jgi:ferric-dicitrate binding protein FerR (iron transport regulator)
MDERDDIAALVRLAGRRRTVPRDRANRVRAAAWTQWNHEVRRRSRNRYIWTAAVLAVAASVVLVINLRTLPFGNGAAGGSDATMLVESLSGAAWTSGTIDGDASPLRALEVGAGLLPGAEVMTSEEGRAAIRLATGHSLRLDASTRVRVLAAGSLALNRGGIYVDSGLDTATASSIDVHTPLGVIRDIGTQFEVRLEDEALRVRLREGAVVVRHDEQAHEVRAGTEFHLDPDGFVSRREIPTHGAEWEWVVGVTPMLDLEGRTARTFLGWVARERGWTLAFADEIVARSAGEIVLGGSAAQLTLEEALDAVLPTCRMTYRIDDGVLLIAASP